MSFARCQRGTASVEIVVMLPLFILLFVGVIHVHRVGLVRQEALATARACAFHFAVNGCTDAAAEHAICAGLNPQKGSPLTNDEAGKDTREHHSLIEAIGSWKVVDHLVSGLFGARASARAERSVPGFMSRHDRKVQGTFYVVCNTVPESWSDKASELMCGAASKLHVRDALGSLGLCK